MKKILFPASVFLSSLCFIFIQLNCSQNSNQKTMTQEELVARGKSLVNLGLCNNCHSPKIKTLMGSAPDTTRLLSGHPSDDGVGDIDVAALQKGAWRLQKNDGTEIVGAWGISFAANLTPDNETGLGTWTADLFIKAIRSGKHMGIGRSLLPPMPWMNYKKLPDEDLKAIFAYLQSLPAVHNQVHDPVPADKLASLLKK
jgi:hypothetical protein